MLREPLWFESDGSKRWGWIHQSTDAEHRRKRVLVMCNPIGHDLIHAYQSIRDMADSFAREGFFVLRFDCAGTGDSEGDIFQGDIIAQWLRDTNNAVSLMRQRFSPESISLLGIRSGALLAGTCAASNKSVSGLMLFDPLFSGKRFIREIKANSRMAYFEPDPDLLESVGFPYPNGMLDSLMQIDLAKTLDGFAAPVIGVIREDAVSAAPLRKVVAACKQFTAIEAAELETMLVEPHHTKIPRAAIDELVSQASMLFDASKDGMQERSALSSEAVLAADTGGSIVEKSVSTGVAGTTGILCSPASGESRRFPVVLLGNAGSIFHIGPNRLYVELARKLAAAGYASFRYDLPNIGDGLMYRHPEANKPYPTDAVARITEVIEYAKQDLGHDSVVLTGFCSGSTQAFMAALEQKPTAPLIEIMMVNPKVFYVEDKVEDKSVDTDNQVMQRSNYYRRAIRDTDRWKRFFTGDVDYKGVFQFIFRRCRVIAGSSWKRLATIMGLNSGTRLGSDLVKFLKTGRRLSFFFSSRDPGHQILLETSGGVAKRLINDGKIPVYIIDDADHTLIALRCRAQFTEKFISHLKKVHPTQSKN